MVARRQKIDRVRRALASGAALGAVLGPDERALRAQAEEMDASDPRLTWLLSQAPRWRDAREKTLVFVAHRETLEMLRTALGARAQVASGVFHEGLTPARRDTEVARFRDHDGPSLLVSTESGGEGRNFEFCRRLVLFDLPWKPSVVEQRIGRLDRIGRRIPVEIVYFRPPAGIGSDVVRLFETLGLFREPLAGLEPQLAHVEGALEEIALDPSASLSAEHVEALVREAHAARTRIREAAYQQLHRDPYRSDMAAGILARVPADLDALNQEVVVTACIGLGFTIEHPRGHRVFAIELGKGAMVDGLPGVPGGSSYVGHVRPRGGGRERDDRLLRVGASARGGNLRPLRGQRPGPGRAVRDWRSARNTARDSSPSTRTGPYSTSWRSTPPAAHDRTGRRQYVQRPLRARAITGEALEDRDWAGTVGRLGAQLDPARRPHALAAIVVRPVE